MDAKTLHTVEFDKIRSRLAQYTSFSGGARLAEALTPTTDPFEARLWQAQTAEAVRLFDSRSNATIGGTRDVRRIVDNAARGFTLSAENFLDIRGTLIASRDLKRKLDRARDRCPNLADVADLIEEIPGLVDAITQTIDERGDVLDSASSRLARIRQDLRVAHGRIQDKLRALVNGPNNQYLQEPLITMRAGRYVVPLRAEHKGRIPGIIHDQSGSGATLWIEPLSTVDVNNAYRSLQLDEQKEVERILADLSQRVAEDGDVLKRIVDRMAELDLIFARGHYALAIGGVEPELVPWRSADSRTGHPGSRVVIRGARHPLLAPEAVVPTDFVLDDETFIVLITGPNTGGKTVALKNIALMVMMAQAGIHLPAEEATLTLFDNVFADIGDEQSIEQSLSTFSGHITNIIRILHQIDDRSLVVLDELGSGTDPSEGAALAQAIVNFLRDKGATTFIATHYPELKLYASQTPGATNASLLFDVETLAPTFELTIGIPGKSNALAIARRLGLDETILLDAMQLVGTGEQDTTTLIDSIYDLRDKISAEAASTRLARRQAEKDRDAVATRLAEIDAERQAILAEARAEAQAELEAVQDEVRRARRRIREVDSLTQLKKVAQELEEQRDEVAAAERATRSPRGTPSTPAARKKPINVGDRVRLNTLNMEGQVIGVSGDEIEVAIGRLHTRTQRQDLVLLAAAEPEPERSGLPSAPLQPKVSMELDLRGNRVEEGLEALEQYLDAAALSNLPWIRIIHGKGTGRLRQALRRALNHSPYVASWSTGKPNEGGDGVTVAKLHQT